VAPQPTKVDLWYGVQLHASSSPYEDMNNERKKIALIFNMDASYCDVFVIEVEREKYRIKP
jgi:hypothetical protein